MTKKGIIIAGTGHRPKYCPCKYNEKHPWLKDLKSRLYADLDVGWNSQQIEYVISGGAIGWDMWLAETAIEVGIPVHMYLPFRDQGSTWPTETQNRFKDLLSKASEVKYISETYSNKAFFKRDEAMIDACDIVFALLNPVAEEGGTYYTVQYAQKQNKEIENYWRD